MITASEPCPTHGKNNRKAYDVARGTPTERGYGTTRWKRYSEWFRRQVACECGRNHVLCEMCQKEPSEMVDHIIPVHGEDDPLFWPHSNHQALSNRCHAIKTAQDRKIAR